jgi:cell division protein FtsB
MFMKLFEKLKKINWTDHRLITVVVIVILVVLMMDFNNRMSNMIQLNQMEKILETKLAGLEATRLVVEDDIAYATSDRALEEWAREKDRLIAEGDHPIIILPPSDYTPSPTPPPDREPIVLTRLEIWKELIFGGEDLP